MMHPGASGRQWINTPNYHLIIMGDSKWFQSATDSNAILSPWARSQEKKHCPLQPLQDYMSWYTSQHHPQNFCQQHAPLERPCPGWNKLQQQKVTPTPQSLLGLLGRLEIHPTTEIHGPRRKLLWKTSQGSTTVSIQSFFPPCDKFQRETEDQTLGKGSDHPSCLFSLYTRTKVSTQF